METPSSQLPDGEPSRPLKSGNKRLFVLLCVSAILYNGVFAFGHARLIGFGKPISATVTSRQVVTPPYAVNYKFEVDGQSYSGTTTVTEKDFHRIYDGIPLPVVYRLGDPSISAGTQHSWHNLYFHVFLMALFSAVAAAALTISHLRSGHFAPRKMVKK